MYCIVLSTRLFQKRNEDDVVVLRICSRSGGYHVPPPSVETGCGTQVITNFEINLSAATNMFLSFEIDSVRISLFSGSIVATKSSQTYSDPTLNNVSSMINSDILLLLEDIL